MPGRLGVWLLTFAAGLFAPAWAFAQTSINLGPASQYGAVTPDVEPGPADTHTGVSFINSAVPMTQFRLRYESLSDNPLHDRSRHLFVRSITGNGGYRNPETNVDMQELNWYIEWNVVPSISLFVETPMRLVNPENNPNSWGQGDINFGFKYVCWADEYFYTTFQLRTYLPTGREEGLGNRLVSIEPGLLLNLNLATMFRIEGELRYWAPLGGNEFSGDHLRYGLGLSYGERTPGQMWLMPVVEAVGWTLLDGQGTVATTPTSYYLRDVGGDNIFTLNAGLRMGLGANADIYAGYGRCITGEEWFRDYWRVEFRWLF